MKLNVKNLKGEVFQIEVEPADNITALKTKIQEVKGMAADTLKVVFKGKTLNNEDTVQKIGIKDTDFIVCMNQVAKPAPKPKEEKKEEPKEEKAEEKKGEKMDVEKEEKKEEPKPAVSQEQEAQINQLMSMGFTRQQCVAALRAAFNNTERAVEYLLNGIPPGLEGLQNPPPQPGQGGQGGQGGQMGIQHLRALFNHPQFAQLRDVLRSNPAAIQPILQQIGQTSPQIYNLIAQHPQEFERIIQGEDDEEGGEDYQGQGQGQQPPPGSIMITPADEQAINRLRQLGFSKIESAQAYFACDKNEDLAANLLFDRLANGDIEMEPQGGQGGSGGSGQGGSGSGGNGPQPPQDEDDDNLFN